MEDKKANCGTSSVLVRSLTTHSVSASLQHLSAYASASAYVPRRDSVSAEFRL